jgi:hypothetical protein
MTASARAALRFLFVSSNPTASISRLGKYSLSGPMIDSVGQSKGEN